MKRALQHAGIGETPANIHNNGSHTGPGRISREGSVFLERNMGLFSVVAFATGNMIASGIFVSPSGVLKNVGSVGLAFIMWAVGGIASLFGSLCYAELGAMLPISGGQYVYIHRAFSPSFGFIGPLITFLVSWTKILVASSISISITLLTLATYVGQIFFDNCGPPKFFEKVIAVCVAVTLAIINARSSSFGQITQNIFTCIKVCACLAISLFGMVRIAQGHVLVLSEGFLNSRVDVASISYAFYSVMWSYSGFETVNSIAEEIINPAKTIPLAMTIAIFLIIAINISINISYHTSLLVSDVISSPAVAVSWISAIYPNNMILVQLIILAVICSTFGAINGGFYSISRSFMAAGRVGHLPQIMSMLHYQWFTPIPAIMMIATLSIVMVMLGDIQTLINSMGFIAWLTHALCFASLLILRKKEPNLIRRYRVPIGIPIFMLLLSLFFVLAPIIMRPTNELLSVVGLMAVGVFVYILLVQFKLMDKAFERVTIWLQLLLCLSVTEIV